MDDGQKFIVKEMSGARPSGEGDYGQTFQIQVNSDTGRSKWLRIPVDRFDAVMAAAAGTEG